MADSLPLALKYRPQVFADLVGQRVNAAILQRMVDSDQVPPALLFSGPSGVGKTSAARVLAASLQASDVIEVDAASNGGVDQVRTLLEAVKFSTGGPHRVLILDEAHSLSRQAFEALLKTLEEPPGRTVFILVTTEPFKIPETVLSRLVEFTFHAVSDPDVLERIAEVARIEGLQAEPDLLRYIAQQSRGNVRTALTSLDLSTRAQIFTLSEFLEISGTLDHSPRILAACLRGDHSVIFQVLGQVLSGPTSVAHVTSTLIACLRDLLVIRSGGVPEVTGEPLEARKALAGRLEQERLLAAIRVFWDLKTKIRADDPRGLLEMSLILVSEIFTRGRAPISAAPAPVPEAPRKLTISEMQQMVSSH